MKKILILSASPQRDKVLDGLLAEKLRAKGNEVFVRPCLREGRPSVLEIKPNVVVLPPIRNIYSRDFAEVCKKWGMGVVTRHTEPSVAWEDFKAVDNREKAGLVGVVSYPADLEIVWSEDEVGILKQRNTPFPVIAVGALMVDIYKTEDFESRIITRNQFCEKHKLNPNKRIILLTSPWGFIDNSPDLHIDGQIACGKDEKGRAAWMDMAKKVYEKFSEDYNILATLHPSIDLKPYREGLKGLNIEIDIESTATELLKNCDLLIHAGSTMGVEMHILNKPALQFGDVNNLAGANWWQRSNAAISRVSPHCNTAEDVLTAIANIIWGKSNAKPETIKELEEGRYGKMDGHATDRAAELIDRIKGEFKERWPDATRDYSQPAILKSLDAVLSASHCGICGNDFVVVNDDYLVKLARFFGVKEIPEMPETICPNCGARMFLKVKI